MLARRAIGANRKRGTKDRDAQNKTENQQRMVHEPYLLSSLKEHWGCDLFRFADREEF